MKKKQTSELFLVRLESAHELIQRIETDIKKVETPDLVRFYVAADRVKKQVEKLAGEKVRKELIERREQGTPSGDNNEHRKFVIDEFELTLQQRKSRPIVPERMFSLLRAKKLEDDATTITLASGPDVKGLNKFLKAHFSELKALGAVTEVKLDQDKIDALVALGKLTLEEVEHCIEKKDPVWALVPKILKDEQR